MERRVCLDPPRFYDRIKSYKIINRYETEVWIAATAAKSDVEKNVNSVDLAKRLGISPQAMSQFANGTTDPSLYRLHTIADALGVRVRELFK